MKKDYFVYLLTDASRTVFRIGVTDNLFRKLYQPRISSHRHPGKPMLRLVYYELSPDALAVIIREKHLRQLAPQQLAELISEWNPTWEDLQPNTVPTRLL